jgi:6-phosphogluconolactonase
LKTSTIPTLSLVLALSLSCGGGGGGGSVSTPATIQPGRFAFVANTLDNTLSCYSVVPDSGRLRPNGYVGGLIGQIAPQEVVVHPTGMWVYTPNLGNGANGANISVYSIDPDTGQTTPLVPAGTGEGPFDMLFGADGRFAYVAAAGSDSIWTYSVHQQTGQLSLTDTPVSDGVEPTSISLGPDGARMFVTYRGGGGVVTYDVDPANGRLTRSVAPFEYGIGMPEFAAAGASGEYLYACYNDPDGLVQLLIDPDTGALTEIASSPLVSPCSGLAIHPGGGWILIARASGSLRVFGIDAESGELSPVDGDVATGVDPVDIAFDVTARFVYVTNEGSNDVSLYDLDLSTGELVPTGSVRARSQPGALAMTSSATTARSFEPRFLYVASEDSGTINGYRVGGTGTLGELSGGGVLAGQSPHSLAVDPFGRFLYTVDIGAHSISAFVIDPGSGRLTAAGLPMPLGGQPRSVTVGPSGRFAFVANAVGRLEAFGIDAQTGELDYRGSAPTEGLGSEAVAVDPTGQFAYVSNHESNTVTALRFDQGFLTGGELRIMSTVTTYVAGDASAIRFAPDGQRAYVTLPGFADQVLPLHIDPFDGSLSIGISGPEDGDDPRSVDIHPDGGYAYAAVNGGVGAVRAFRVEQGTGALRNPVTYVIGMNPIDLRVDPGGDFLYVVNEQGHDISFLKIDRISGALELRAAYPTDTRPVSIGITGVLR